MVRDAMPDNSESFALTGLRALVTGASRGIGRAIAVELAAAGADVAVHGWSDPAGLEETAAMIRQQGRETTTMVADLADMAQHEPLVASGWAWRDGLDIWVNNAGADVLTGDAAGWPFERKLERLWQVDVVGTMRLSRLAGYRMQRVTSGVKGAIVNIGWDQAETGMEGDSGQLFAAVKGAVMAFTKSLAKSLAPDVRVNAVAPGWIRTRWGESASDPWQQRAVQESLLLRWGAPHDVARAVRFLASPAADFITGQVLPVNGGRR